MDMYGIVAYDGLPVSIEEMDEAIAQAVSDAYGQSLGEAR
jgi:actin-like ATPase involved in cell morphogenesis